MQEPRYPSIFLTEFGKSELHLDHPTLDMVVNTYNSIRDAMKYGNLITPGEVPTSSLRLPYQLRIASPNYYVRSVSEFHFSDHSGFSLLEIERVLLNWLLKEATNLYEEGH
jgi:hypothetical protein